MADFSSPTKWQSDLMARMLALDIDRVDLLRQQAETAETKVIDEDGSFQVRTSGPPWMESQERVPIEAECFDRDNTPVEVLMHVIDGLIDELEIYRVDGRTASPEFSLGSMKVTAVFASGSEEIGD
jgi:hypothetical protein